VAGLNQTLNGALNIVAPPLGALLLELVAYHSVMLVDVTTAMLAIVPLLFVTIPQPRRDDLGVGQPSVWADMGAGLRYIWSWPGLVILIGAAMIMKIALTPAFSLLPLLVSDHFGGDAAQYSLLEAVVGAGIVAGGLLLSTWGGFPRRIHTTIMGVVGIGLGLGLLGLVPGELFWMALGCIFLVGLMIPMTDGPIMAIIQSSVSPEVQGRVFTMMGSLLWITSPFSLAVAGPVSDWLGLQVWYLAAGTLCAIVGLAGFFIRPLVAIEENVNGRKLQEPVGTRKLDGWMDVSEDLSL
jgi:DHA3 family macrolide efflux protein-like MFS transporter